MLAPVIGAVHTAALRGAEHRVHAPRLARRCSEADPSQFVLRGGQAGGDPPPRGPTIGRLVQAVVARERPGAADLPGRLARRPQDGEHRLGIRGVEGDIHRAGVLVRVEHPLPRFSTVGRAEHAALGIRAVGMAEHGDQDAARIVRIDDEGRDLLAVRQAEVTPRLAGVAGLVDPVAHGEVGALQPFARADVDDGGIGGSDGERADRARRLPVEQRGPGAPVIRGAPHAAVIDADVEQVGLTRHARRGHRAAAAKRADRAPMQVGKQGRVVLLRASG